MISITSYGAVANDGIDDAPAIRAAIKEAADGGISNRRYTRPREVYIPAGTWDIGGTIEAKGDTGTWSGWRSNVLLVGAGQDQTILRLKDNTFTNAASPQAVYKTGSENPFGDGENGQAFHHFVGNLTIDTGRGNPGAIGIDYLANNGGGIDHVTIKSEDGAGIAGIAMNRQWPGPALIKNVEIDGFNDGIELLNHFQYSMTIEDLTLNNQLSHGIIVENNELNVENLTSNNTVPAVYVEPVPGYSYSYGQINLIDSTLNGGSSSNDAIFSAGNVFVRNVSETGYGTALHNTNGPGGSVAGNGSTTVTIPEYNSQTVLSQFSGTGKSLNLPIQETPEFNESDLNKWSNVITDGAVAENSSVDSAPAIQAAIDNAASRGKTTVYLPSGGYYIGQNVYLRGSVRKIVGTQSAIFAKSGSSGASIIFTGDSSSNVILEHLHFDVPLVDSGAGTLTVRYCDWSQDAGLSSTSSGTGKLFLDSVDFANGNNTGGLNINGPLHVWARQLNVEYGTLPMVTNNGGTLWILGYKTEGQAEALKTTNGSTEVIGGFFYPLDTVPSGNAIFESTDSSVSYSFATNGNFAYPTLVRETRAGVTKELSSSGQGNRVTLYSGVPNAQTVTPGSINEFSATPAIDADDISKTSFTAGDASNSFDNDSTFSSAGQYFTPSGTGNYKLDSFSFKGNGLLAGGASNSGSLTVTLGTYVPHSPTSGNGYSYATFTPIGSHTYTGITANNLNDWFTIASSDLGSPTLTGGTTYGFRISNNGSYFGLNWQNTTEDTVSGAGYFSGNNLYGQANDRLFVARLTAVAPSYPAGVVTETAAAPTLDADDIAKTSFTAGDASNSFDNDSTFSNAGQYFTPSGTGNYKLDSFSLKGNGLLAGGASTSGNLTVTLGTFVPHSPTSGNGYSYATFTPIGSHTYTISASNLSDWFSISGADLGSPTLTGGTTYAIRISNNGSYFGLNWQNTTEDTIGGAGYVSGNNLYNQGNDRLFVAKLTATS